MGFPVGHDTTVQPIARRRSDAPQQRRDTDAASSTPASPLAALTRAFAPAALEKLLGLERGALPLGVLQRAALDPASEVLRRPGKRFRARLVEIGWALGGATRGSAEPLAHVIELIHAGSMIVDDIEDGSTHRRGAPALHHVYGLPLALNTGNLLYFLPLPLLDELALPDAVALDLHRRIGRTMLRAHCGQALDLGVSIAELAQADVAQLVHAVSELKTGSLMGLAASLGAVVAGAPRPHAVALERFGGALGVALQMLDDVGNVRGGADPHKRHEDLRLGRPTWIWAWLAATLQRDAFARLQREAAQVQAGAPPEPLAERLCARLGEHGRQAARRELDAALGALRAALGSHAALDELAVECARLEVSYG